MRLRAGGKTFLSTLSKTGMRGNVIAALWVMEMLMRVVQKKLIRKRWQVQVLKALYTASAEFSFHTELRIKAYIGYKNQTQVIAHECPHKK